ncbi:hypothetical protein K469DRAFT_728284 [Zopfia rhizophila CBS 207.26]|uniref:DUF1996 domain-containing protein n=1 Tax=Zopfia rhizophila CBS 207.26 TaxID=1314779 RepID=A0A6A6DTA5_9PEZI|nr:hypothetical protein K469DRAFT_728284 [Zopfia rhizophila CBS 207.26]
MSDELEQVFAGARPCSTLTVQRLDPVIQAGLIPSTHVNHIVGGNAFNATMTGDHPTNGSYHRVPVVPVQPLLGFSGGTQSGITVYYTQFDLSRDNIELQPIKAFSPDFRMTVGNPASSTRPQVGLRYQCLQAQSRGAGMPDFPTRPCSGGIFTTHHFPALMYNTIRSDGFMNAPACPASDPVCVLQVTHETVWDTTKFNSMWSSGAPNPFKGDSLQRAMDKSDCFYNSCGSIPKQPMATANQCAVKNMVRLRELPGQAKSG